MKLGQIVSCLALAALVGIAPSCGGGSGGSPSDGTYFVLTGNPDPSTVFNSPTVCFLYDNNLTNGVWHQSSNLIVVGEYSSDGYWSHIANASGYPATPNNGTGGYRRLVHMPRTELVAYTDTASGDGIGASPSSDLLLATMDGTTGALGVGTVAIFSDSYTGSCNVLSSSVDELFILADATTIRRYSTTTGSNMLTFVQSIALSQAVPTEALCTTACYGGTFAWDGRYFYIPRDQGLSGSRSYDVFQENGTFVATASATGTGSLNGVYFDWSVGRYAIHDGYGDRTAPTVYDSLSAGESDSQCYGPVSTTHTFHP